MPARARVVACLLATTPGAAAAASAVPAGDQAFASYAFAAEFGTGIYEFNGRSLQIYRIPLALQREGWRLTLPVTVGLVDFSSTDVIDLKLPHGIGSVSLVPGIERDVPLTPDWTLTHFLRAGFTRTSGRAANAVVAATGLRSLVLRPRYQFYSELTYAVADLRGPPPGDAFLRVRNAIQGDLPAPLPSGERRLHIAPYLMVDLYAQPPTSPVSGRDAQRRQTELGLSFTLDPRPTRLGIPLPAVGLSYRFAGDLSGWRLAIGAPF